MLTYTAVQWLMVTVDRVVVAMETCLMLLWLQWCHCCCRGCCWVCSYSYFSTVSIWYRTLPRTITQDNLAHVWRVFFLKGAIIWGSKCPGFSGFDPISLVVAGCLFHVINFKWDNKWVTCVTVKSDVVFEWKNSVSIGILTGYRHTSH